jgi:hypothetical protein
VHHTQALRLMEAVEAVVEAVLSACTRCRQTQVARTVLVRQEPLALLLEATAAVRHENKFYSPTGRWRFRATGGSGGAGATECMQQQQAQASAGWEWNGRRILPESPVCHRITRHRKRAAAGRGGKLNRAA